jgi:hypothetical protein
MSISVVKSRMIRPRYLPHNPCTEPPQNNLPPSPAGVVEEYEYIRLVTPLVFILQLQKLCKEEYQPLISLSFGFGSFDITALSMQSCLNASNEILDKNIIGRKGIRSISSIYNIDRDFIFKSFT